MNKGYFLLGGGGHAGVVYNALPDVIKNSVILVAPQISDYFRKIGVEFFDDDYLNQLSQKKSILINGVGWSRNNLIRNQLFDSNKARGFNFFVLLHRAAFLCDTAILSEGCQVMASASVQSNVFLDSNVVVNTGAVVEHDCFIGKHSFISSAATICGGVKLGKNVFIGAGATVMPGLTIGDNVIVGAGSLVNKSISSGEIVAGVPAFQVY